jgi:hypothetical protein
MDSGFSSTNIPQTGSFATFFLLFIVITTCISVGLYNCKNIIRQFPEEIARICHFNWTIMMYLF